MKTISTFRFAAVATALVIALAIPALSLAQLPDLNHNTTVVRDVAAANTTNPAQNTTVSWGAVFGGAVVALSLQMLFTILGAGIGLAAIDPYDRNNPLRGVPTGALVWWLVTGLVSLFVGGWVSGKLSGATTITDASMAVAGLHGLVMWSLATVLSFLLLMTSAGALVGGLMRILFEGISLLGKGAAATASAAAPLVGDLAKETAKQVVPSFDWEKVKREVRSVLRDTGKQELKPENVEQKADQAKKDVQNFVKDPLAGDEELSSMLSQVYGQAREAVNAADKAALVNMISARTGKNKEQITKSIEQVEKIYQDTKREYQEAIATAERKAREAAAETASVLSKVTIWTFVALVSGMIITTLGATTGVSRPTLFYFW